ncbi:MAG: type III-B CRISPR module-associated protein Cmr5 [Lachnospiraceae bacterium]|nr:type III-B CRISPR module-associated protein Cmr5 [Lachnospiraceae bacterium]
MNKKVINDEIQYAYNALISAKIVSDSNKINKAYRGQISTFGAAVQMGSLKAAIAFFMKDASGSGKNGQEVHRSKILDAILCILKDMGKVDENTKGLFAYVSNKVSNNEEDACREEIINASIALKLAMNLFELSDGR